LTKSSIYRRSLGLAACASLKSILAIEDTWERERSGFAEEKVWGDIPVVTGFWGGKEDFLGELAVWSPEVV
ncbi:hypothetical protein Tco_1550883, partial [Tanacetum coccineum]